MSRSFVDRMLGGVVVAIPLLAVLGCDPDSGTEDPEGGMERIADFELGELGEGRGFAPLDSGQTLWLHQGLQGGYHVFVDGRTVGDVLEQSCLIQLRLVGFDDDQEVSLIEHLREPDVLPDSEGNATFDDLIVFVVEPDEIVGRQLRLEATVDAGDAIVEGDEALVTIEWAP